jgi:NAD+ synthase
MGQTPSLRFTAAQVNPIVGDISGNVNIIESVWAENDDESDLIVFPELVITGYMPEDLLLNGGFTSAAQDAIARLVKKSLSMKSAILVGSPAPDKAALYNAAYLIEGGKILSVTHKVELPNYGVFDERRYFISGTRPEPIDFRGHKLGIMICEDMWFPNVADYLSAKASDVFIVINGSPFEPHKQSIRIQHARARVRQAGIPLLYVNQVGGQDDLIYDGASFALNSDGEMFLQCEEFIEEIQTFSFSNEDAVIHKQHTETESLYQAAMLGVRDYMRKTGQAKILIGMSGGIDSALSAAIAVDAIGADNVRCVMMPSEFTSPQSISDATDCAEKLGIRCDTIPVSTMVDSFMKLLPDTSGLAHENLQARLRGLILMTISNQTGAMVLTTGNKSEMACGYATLYGDMCGGYNVLKDLYKTQVYNLAHWRNSTKPVNAFGNDGIVINDFILSKAPTAELRPDQKDQDSLPPYDELDAILMGLIEEDLSPTQMAARGHNPEVVAKVSRLLKISEYKRRQSATGAKLSPRAFARERRYPIVNGF